MLSIALLFALASSSGAPHRLAASELGAVARLPYDANRTTGAVRQFANHYRAKDRRPIRTADAFRTLQARIEKAVPDEIRQLIGTSKGELRVITDAQLEWLDLDGVPLGVRRDVAHIPTTPGNLLLGQLEPKETIRLLAEGQDVGASRERAFLPAMVGLGVSADGPGVVDPNIVGSVYAVEFTGGGDQEALGRLGKLKHDTHYPYELRCDARRGRTGCRDAWAMTHSGRAQLASDPVAVGIQRSSPRIT